ncbi:hypothetical protein [Leptospira santarosai]|uniref:hypothetical protein n=1 Tax=Leptospira santarosai TaxID=28183 RepID=UPI0024AFBEE7|nr:hypothetical protein [Leptospira santarosai]MDI7183581.1 hypothetical protein [Leptospira santarosai]
MQRNEYIAEKILDGDRICHDNKFLGWYIPKVYRFFPIDTDFESLPEWTGPICDVVLPMLAEEDLFIYPYNSGRVEIREACVPNPFKITDSEKIDEICFTHGLSLISALIDAHMKISEEKGEQ